MNQEKMRAFIRLLEQFTPQEGMNQTSLENVIPFKASHPHHRKPEVYPPVIVIGGQGSKYCYLDGKRYNYSAGNLLTLFVPLPIEIEITAASPEEPHLALGIKIDLNRLSNMLLQIDRLEPISTRPDEVNASGIFSAPLRESLLDAAIRLLKTLNNPTEAALLSDSVIDEVYFRILNDEQGGTLKHLLQQRGQIQQISRAVEFVHQNLDQQVSVDELAEIVNMSSSGFHKKFKEVVHMSPVQYAKSIKLNKAQAYIMEGKSVSEAGYMVGYNSPAQFSREYKRQFGFAPSAT